MPRVHIERDRCKGCGLCIEHCPGGVLALAPEINQKGYFFAHTDRPDHCLGCRVCAIVCPDVAIEISVHGTQYHYFDY